MKPRVLVVEDNRPNLKLMTYLLEAFGYEVTGATDGREGALRASAERPDLVLMDLHMPDVDGYEALRMIRADEALDGVPVVAVTAFSMVGDRERALAAGFDGYVAKPILPERFLEIVGAYVRGEGRPSAGATP